MQLTTIIFASLSSFSMLTQALPTEAESALVLARSGTRLTQAQAEAILRKGGVKWRSTGNCSDRSKSSCTSFEGILSGTVNNAVTLKKSCACEVIITGGTEVGHASGTYSHSTGYKLDFAFNSGLDKYIMDHFTKISNRGGDNAPQWKSPAGNIYAKEGNHWDVIYF